MIKEDKTKYILKPNKRKIDPKDNANTLSINNVYERNSTFSKAVKIFIIVVEILSNKSAKEAIKIINLFSKVLYKKKLVPIVKINVKIDKKNLIVTR